MLSYINFVLFSFIIILISFRTCKSDLLPPLAPSLALYTPGEPEYTDILVKRVGDNLTLVCELKGDIAPRLYVWNYVAANGSAGESKQFTIEPAGATASSMLTKPGLQLGDSGQYMCSAPPFSVTKYIHVQPRGPRQCARGAFWCGARCVLATYVCDGRRDCLNAEDEAPSLCGPQPCLRSDRLNCSTGRCISEAACCRGAGPAALCRQPACCDEHPRFSRVEGYVDMEYPALFEDRHAPDDYGFIQSTIYTVTACALIFMIAVVLLVSAICKMHMKRAALRSYANADRATRQHYNMHYAQAHRFPPCYEASRLLEQEARNASVVPSPAQSANNSPTRQQNSQCNTECSQEEPPMDCAERTPDECRGSGFGLARLSAIFTSRYRQVPTQCCDVEMTDVRSTSLNSSPTRNQIRTRLDDYRSPTYCDLNADFLFNNPETGNCGRDLNYMATPVEFFRRRTLRTSALERVIDQIDRQRPLTLHLGRFQLSIPRFSRRSSSDRRPDTPNVAEINIDDLDFVRLNSNDTYTLNGRTIRLLGANFENYPVLSDTTVRPPPYNEAMRYKLYGPPPEYLSREGLNNEREIVTVNTNNVDEEARNNVEMPPRYEDLASGVDNNANVENNDNNNASCSNTNQLSNVTVDNEISMTNNQLSVISTVNNVDNLNVPENISSVIDNLPAIDSDVNANDSLTETVINNVAVDNALSDNRLMVNNN